MRLNAMIVIHRHLGRLPKDSASSNFKPPEILEEDRAIAIENPNSEPIVRHPMNCGVSVMLQAKLPLSLAGWGEIANAARTTTAAHNWTKTWPSSTKRLESALSAWQTAQLACSPRLSFGATLLPDIRQNSVPRPSPDPDPAAIGQPAPDFGEDERRRLEFLNREPNRPSLLPGQARRARGCRASCYAALRRYLRDHGRDGIGATEHDTATLRSSRCLRARAKRLMR
jgi:hypothetical protein